MNRDCFSSRSTHKMTCMSDSETSSNIRHICRGKEDKSIETKERLLVFCRVWPMHDQSNPSYITITPPKTITVSSPNVIRDGVNKETNYVFSEVFDENAPQKELFMKTTFDLVEYFLKGSNGLLFTCGIPGSGKTYMMNGVTKNIGILPRCINLIFNSVSGYQAKTYIIKSDNLNGFKVQSELDAMADRQCELSSSIKTPLTRNIKESKELVTKRLGLSSPSTSSLKIDIINHEHMYSLFVTYVEIYNNGVYDLLEDTPDGACHHRMPQPKLVREDSARNMYVHGVTEVEVKSADEAFELYFKGQKKRRLAETVLNTVCNQSHAIFSIRCVRVSTQVDGDSLKRNRYTLRISQLSFVDLATSKTSLNSRAFDKRLGEPSCMNNSLLTLRRCLEILRENQTQNTNKLVPYQESKLTHLFKKYFEGDGDHHIRMIVCINPWLEDYEETLQVLNFSEMCKDILINHFPVEYASTMEAEKVQSLQTISVNKTPSKNRLHNSELVKAKSECDIASIRTTKGFDNINLLDLVEPSFPDFSDGLPDGHDLIAFLEEKMQKNDKMNCVMQKMASHLCSRYNGVEIQRTLENDEINRLSNQLNCERLKTAECENHIFKCNAKINDLQMKAHVSENTIKSLKNDLIEKDLLLSKTQADIIRERNQYKCKLMQSKEEIIEMEVELQKQKNAIELQILESDQILSKSRKSIIYPESYLDIVHKAPKFKESQSVRSTRITCDLPTYLSTKPGLSSQPSPSADLVTMERTHDKATSSMLSYGQKQTISPSIQHCYKPLGNGNGHCSSAITQTAPSVLQPVIKHRKSVSEFTGVNDLVNSKTSKYCLTMQMLDSRGDLETHLFKADVISTAGGRAQAKSNDIEILHDKSPVLSRAYISTQQKIQRTFSRQIFD